MANEIQRQRSNYQNELTDLQLEYAKKRKKLTEKEESAIDEIQQNYQNKKEDTEKSGEAAINHIRERQNKVATQLKENYNNSVDRNQKKLNEIENDYQEKVSKTYQSRHSQLQNIQDKTHEELAKIENQSEERLSGLRQQTAEQIKHTKERSNQQLKEINEFSAKRITGQKEQAERDIASQKQRGEESKQKLLTRQQKEFNTIHSKNEERIQKKKELGEVQIQRLDAHQEKELQKEQEHWNARRDNQSHEYTQRIHHDKAAYEKQMKNLHDRHKSMYEKTEVANRQSLNVQDENFNKALLKQKMDHFRKEDRYRGKEADPFYKVDDRGSKLSEDRHFYYLKAFVPDHERDKVKVSVQGDKATVSGQRSFQDKISEGNKSIETNNYQSFREDFLFDQPVITEGMTRERQGDFVTFKIPKMAQFKFDRKA